MRDAVSTRGLGRKLLMPLLLLLLVGCGEPDTPEAQVRERIALAQSLAEDKDVLGLGDLIADGYRDDGQRDRRALTQLFAYYFFRHKSVHLLVHIDRIEFPVTDRASVTLFVAMAGRPVTSADELLGVRASLYRFDLEFGDQGGGDWLLSSSRWRPAEQRDFVGAGAL